MTECQQRYVRLDCGQRWWGGVQVAMQQADYVAWNLWAAINGRTLLPFKYQHLGTMLTFGRASGAVKLNVPLPPRAAPSLPAAPGTRGLCCAAAQPPPTAHVYRAVVA